MNKLNKLPSSVRIEAIRLAKALIKDTIRQQGGKVSNYEAKEITKAANTLLACEVGAELIAKAKYNVDNPIRL